MQPLGSLGKLSGATLLDMTTMSGQLETLAGTTTRKPDQRCATLHSMNARLAGNESRAQPI